MQRILQSHLVEETELLDYVDQAWSVLKKLYPSREAVEHSIAEEMKNGVTTSVVTRTGLG